MMNMHGPVQYGWVASIRGSVKRLERSCCLLLLLAATAAAKGAEADDRICLWSIQTATTELYLLGSIHAVKPDMYPLPEAFERAYGKADTLVVEVNPYDMQPSDLLLMQEKGHYQDGDTIEDNLSPDTLMLLHEYLAEEGMSMDSLRTMRPWLLSMTLAIRQITALGYDPSLGIDIHFLGRARQAKRILQLETISEQIGILADDPPHIQELILKANLIGLDETEAMLDVLIDAWKRGDVDEMYSITTMASDEDPVLDSWLNKLITERNLRMVEKIKGYLSTKGSFLVIAGALHMGGEQGIVNLLRERYTVTQYGRSSHARVSLAGAQPQQEW